MSTPPPIVVGTDLSEPADEAVRQAAAWARRSGAPLLVVHIAPEKIFRDLATPGVAAAIEQRLEPLIDIPAEVIIESGSEHAGIIRVADARHAQLLVVGASVRDDIEARFFGGTAEHVVRYAHCPVLTARPSPSGGPVLVATDFSDLATPAVSAAAEQARQRGVELVVLHSIYEPKSPLSLLGPVVVSVPETTEEALAAHRGAAQETVESLLQATGLPGSALVVDEPPARGIIAAASTVSAALVVVGTRGRTGLFRMALGSVAEAVVHNAPCSVLAVRLPV